MGKIKNWTKTASNTWLGKDGEIVLIEKIFQMDILWCYQLKMVE